MATKLRKSSPNLPADSVVGASAQGRTDATISRTMLLAQASGPYSWPLSSRKPASQVVSSHHPSRRETPNPKPTDSTAQYWAARALTAEALLSARETHHIEIRSLSPAENEKRNREISTLTEGHHMRLAKLERLVMVLVASLCSLVALVVYLTVQNKRQNTQSSWLRPSHFTIPIFSPFTSVVEHETSVIGSKVITVVLCLATVLAYFLLRRRIFLG